MSQPRIFVSHSHKDDTFTGRLVADLQQAGADAWMDKTDLGAGDFQQRISEALGSCDWFVLVLTRAALASPWVLQEVSAANALKHSGQIHNLIFMLAERLDYRELPALWRVYNILDATTHYATALDLIVAEVGLPPIHLRFFVADGPKVYICHHHEDAAFTSLFAAQLRQRGADVCTSNDVLYSNGHAPYYHAIRMVANRWEWFMIIASQRFLTSSRIGAEVDLARDSLEKGDLHGLIGIDLNSSQEPESEQWKVGKVGLGELSWTRRLGDLGHWFVASEEDYEGALDGALQVIGCLQPPQTELPE